MAATTGPDDTRGHVLPALGMGALFAAVLILAVHPPVYDPLGPGWFRELSYRGSLCGILVCSLVYLAALRNRGLTQRLARLAGSLAGSSLVLGVVLSLLGLAVMRSVAQPGAEHGGLCLIGGLLQGLGLSGLTICWSRVLPSAGFAMCARGLAWSLLAGSVLWLVAFFVPAEGGAQMWSTALVVATSACLLASRPDEQGQPLSPPPEPEPLGRFLTRMWVPFSSLVLCAFVAGLTFDFSAAQITATTAQKALLYSMGAVPSSLALGLLLRNAPNDVRAGQLLCGAAFPLALALVLVTPILQVMVNAGEPFNSVCGSVSIMGFVVITVVSCATLLVAGRTARIARERVVSGVLLGCSAAALAGSLAIGSLGPNGRILCMVVEAALITALAIWYARGNSLVQDDASPAMRIGAEPAQAPDTAQAPEAPSFQGNCDLLAEQHMLSPREREVLVLLGRGYGSGYIAAQLGISENTARTHTRHIYEKLGVSSREALIDLLR